MANPDTQRDPVESLADDFIERIRRGESPAIRQYEAAHPQHAERIRELFPTIAKMEQLKLRKEQSTSPRADLAGVHLERLGDFRILREIGRGGMGIVYEAEQESLGRRVAVKVLPKSSLFNPKQVRRFQREAQTAARLHHTNIVPVFGVGQHQGFHYIVMPRIHGVGLDHVLGQLERIISPGSTDTQVSPPAEASSESESPADVMAVARALIEGDSPRVWDAPDAGDPARCPGGSNSSEANTAAKESGNGDREARWPGKPTEVIVATEADTVPQKSDAETEETRRLASPQAAVRFGPAYWQGVARLGAQVADALDYAHQRNTLHRDVKPANLLVDRQGVVWVTDFGLAKAMEHDSISHTGEIAGTLRYMAPERFRGQADARGDIYSLGLSLYELLTLHPAYEHSDPSSLIRKITGGAEPARPRSVNPAIPRDLETIVLKAAARHPEDRYESARQLADDLEAYLDDRPIQARRTSPIERLWRWCRRNPAVAGLTATTGALLALVAVVATIGYLLTRSANVQAVDAWASESKQRAKAEAISGLALDALDNIFRRFAPDRSPVISGLTVVGDEGDEIEVPVQPVLSKEAASLLEEMLAFYDRLADQGAQSAELRQKVAEANRRIGQIRHRLGHFDSAKEAYHRAIDLYRELHDASPRHTAFLIEIARIHNELGDLHLALGQPDEAQSVYLKALATLESAPSAFSTTPQHRYELARTYYGLGKRGGLEPGLGPPGPPHGLPGRGRGPFFGQPFGGRSGGGPGRMAQGLRHFGRPAFEEVLQQKAERLRGAIRLLEELAKQYPSTPDYRHLLALCYRDMPPERPKSTGPPASDSIPKATEILQKLVEDFPDVPDYRYDLCETYAAEQRPGWFFGPRDHSTTEQRLKKALEISKQLVAEHPNVADYQTSQVRIQHKLARLLGKTGQHREAEALLREALARQESLVERFPEVSSYRVWQAVVQESLARLLLGNPRQHVEARSLLEQSVAILNDQLQNEPKNPMMQGLLVRNCMSLASVLDQMGEKQAAAEARQRARGRRARM